MPSYSIEPQDLKKVEGIAVEREITFYDASYVYIAEAYNLKLITLDKNLLNKCKTPYH